MTFETWWKKEHFGKDYDISPVQPARRASSQAQRAWNASRRNTRQAVLEYMDFLEDEYPADEWWESLKVFVKGKGI